MTRLVWVGFLAISAAALQLTAQVTTAAAATQPPNPVIQQPELFIDKCPQNDPAYSTIRADFAILRDGLPVTTALQCTEPYTSMPTAQYSEELVIEQAMRVAYYLDLGRANYLPWTPLRFYDWMKSKVAGFDILSTATVASCCALLGGKSYIFFPGIHDDAARQYHLTLRGVFSNTAVLGHETRHVDGYLHNSCCSVANGCDTAYDETNLSTYGIQFYMQRLLLTGDWNLNIGCLDPVQLGSRGAFQLGDANNFASRFCTVKPPVLPATTPIGAVCAPGPYPYISAGGIANSASFKTDAIAPGSLVSVFGPNLATATGAATVLPLTNNLANVTVEMSGNAAPLWSVNAPSPSGLAQVNAQVPYELAAGVATMRVTAGGNVGFRRQFKVTATGPGIFTYGANHAVLFNQDGQVNSSGTPAPAGSYVAMYFTGQGALPIPLATGAGAPLDPLIHAIGPAVVQVGGFTSSDVPFVGLTPQSVGVSQANFQIPANLPPGDYSVSLTVGTQTTTGPLVSVK